MQILKYLSEKNFAKGETLAKILDVSPGNRVYVAGGMMRADGRGISGELCCEFLERFRGDKTFLSIGSITAESGVTDIAPILAPGAAIGQVASILIGTEIAAGVISPVFALPALFAINAQVGSDFVPVGLSLAEAKPETVKTAVPTFLFSRMLTGPLAVLIAYGISVAVGLYS